MAIASASIQGGFALKEEDQQERPEELEEWLEANVLIVPEPQAVTLFSFNLNWSEWSGKFKVKFDDFHFHEWLGFRVSENGRPKFDLPIFTSPLNVPASFSAVRLTEMTSLAINEGLNCTFPRLKPLGKNRETGIEITYSTPMSERISEWQTEAVMRLVDEDYRISVTLSDL